MKINIEVNSLDELKELCAQLTGGIVVAEPTPTAAPKEEKKKPAKAKTKKATTPGTDSTRDTEPSEPGVAQDSIEEEEEVEVETSATANLHPEVTKDEVVALVKNLMQSGQTDKVKLALGRIGANRVTDVPEDKLGVFYTDLETFAK